MLVITVNFGLLEFHIDSLLRGKLLTGWVSRKLMRSRRVENLVSTGIRSRTVEPVVSRYTD